jgi:hypothetical protein
MTPNDWSIIEVYIGQFAARTDAYVKDSRAHIAEALTVDVIADAYEEGFSVSGYMAVKQTGVPDTTHVGAIDFDMEDGMSHARDVRTLLREHHIPSLLEGSRRGAHLWVTCDPVPGKVMRRALKQALGLLAIDTAKAEIFPKQSGSAWGVGALRMPLMRHPKTGVRYPAYGPADEVINRLSECLLAFDQTHVDRLRAFAGPGDALSPIPAPSGPYRLLRASTGDEPKVSALLAMFGLTALPGRSVRCPFHDDRHASLSIADDDERVWCKAPECPLYNDGTGLGSLALEALVRKGPPRHDLQPRPDTHGVPGGLPR